MVRCCGTFLIPLVVLFSYVQQPSHSVAVTRQSSGSPAPQTAAPPSVVSCSPETPVVWPKEIIHVRLWDTKTGPASHYTWTPTGGHIDSQSAEVFWDFTGVQPGYYTATVRYGDAAGGSATCSVQVVVQEREGSRGAQRESGHDLLVRNTSETKGYGLYSYLLLGAPPDDISRERYLKLIEAYLRLVPRVADLEKYFDRRQLNITYIPVEASPRTPPSVEWLLQHYDYARAHFLMRSLPGTHPKGPYIVSSLKPLSASSTLSGPYLLQDCSSVPPHLISAWMEEFLNQTAQERFWEESSGKKLVLKLRTTIGILAAGLPYVRNSLDDWIVWTH